ncbi:hypothetical protein RRG08_034930 [Elysia crispata]|uniref:Uncharacterized protein n=1 Tax=Elysia crispata TaxID=231223 RepID=A0AAE0Y1Y9_9GAST|nr:hypothetical protein RRG08_034930 [Elysia crispata]
MCQSRLLVTAADWSGRRTGEPEVLCSNPVRRAPDELHTKTEYLTRCMQSTRPLIGDTSKTSLRDSHFEQTSVHEDQQATLHCDRLPSLDQNFYHEFLEECESFAKLCERKG